MTFRPFLLCVTLSLAAVPAGAEPGSGVRAGEALPLRHINGAILQTRMKAHPELKEVIAYPSTNEVVLRGTEAQKASARSLIAQLDVVPVQYSVKLRVVRCTVDAAGKRTEHTTSAPLVSTLDGLQAAIGAGNTRFSVTPTGNPDGTVTLDVEFRTVDEAGDVGLWAETERRLTLGKSERILGLVNSADKSLRKAVYAGRVPTDRGAYAADYLDVTVQRIDPASGLPG